MHPKRTPKVMQHAPYKWLAKVRSRPFILWKLFRLQVQHQNSTKWNRRQKRLNKFILPKDCVREHPTLEQPHRMRINASHRVIHSQGSVSDVGSIRISRMNLVERIRKVNVIRSVGVDNGF